MEYVFRKPTGSPADRGEVSDWPRVHDDLVNRGRHVIYSGGDYDSHLLVPVLGPTSAA